MIIYDITFVSLGFCDMAYLNSIQSRAVFVQMGSVKLNLSHIA